MTITIGSRLPEVTLREVTPEGVAEKTTTELFSGKRVVLFAVPGAFTPTCHNSHLPGFVFNADNFKAKGVDFIACTAVNDYFVMKAWAHAAGAEGNIVFLADGSADFAKAIGLELDASAGGLGIRSKRYSMLVEDGVVKALNVEQDSSKAETSSAETLLAAL